MDIFWYNPVLFLEIARIKCGAARCVLPQQIFAPSVKPSDNVKMTEKEALESLRDTLEYRMVEKLGLKLRPFVTFVNRILSRPTVSPNIQFFVHQKCEKEFKRMREIEIAAIEGFMNFDIARNRLIEIEGKMFGYPKCCVDGYITGKSSLPAESRLILEGIDSGIFDELLEAFLRSEIISLPQFFTSGFYPCSIECRRAVKVGRRIERWLDDYRDAFRIRCMINALHLLVTGYAASKGRGEFSRKVKAFYSTIGDEKLELIQVLQPHLSNITAFTNIFLYRVVGKKNQKN